MKNQISQPSLLQMALRARKGSRRSGARGMTLVEIMIVVIIMAMIAGAVGVAVLPQMQRAKVNATKSDGQALSSAVVLYFAQSASGECPDVNDLVEAGVLDRSKRVKDAWDKDFSITCEGTEVTIISGGPDLQMGTEDDIRVGG